MMALEHEKWETFRGINSVDCLSAISKDPLEAQDLMVNYGGKDIMVKGMHSLQSVHQGETALLCGGSHAVA